METLKEKEQEKIHYGLLLLKSQDRLPKKFVKLVRDEKKTQKTPQNEIEKAIKIKEAYYADKQSQNR